MKKFSQAHLAGLFLYRWLLMLGIASVVDIACQCNQASNDETVSLAFEKLSYDRANGRIVVVIKNTGDTTATDLSLQCTNISEDNDSRDQVLLDTRLREATIPVEELSPQAVSKEIYVEVDYQSARNALVEIAVKSGQQVVTTQAIEVNQYPIKLVPIGPTLAVEKQGKEVVFKYKLETDEPVNFSLYKLAIYKDAGEDITVSIGGTSIALNTSIDSQTIAGPDLKKVAQQKEIIVKVTNHSAGPISITSELVNHNDKQVAIIQNQILPTLPEALIPAARVGDLALLQRAIAALTNKASGIRNQHTRQRRLDSFTLSCSVW